VRWRGRRWRELAPLSLTEKDGQIDGQNFYTRLPLAVDRAVKRRGGEEEGVSR